MVRLNLRPHCASARVVVRFILFSAMVMSWLTNPAQAGEALYFSLQNGAILPGSPTSVIFPSHSFIDVPAGAVLRVHLMRGEERLATSRLEFTQAFRSSLLIPPAQIASFLPLGTTVTTGQPLPDATLNAGVADLQALATTPGNYRFLWELSSGVMGAPGRVVVTGAPTQFVDLKLCAVSAASAVGDQKPGSVLFFQRYLSNAVNTAREDTALSLTNTNPTQDVRVRLFLVNGATCQVSEVQVCLAAQQTATFLLSDIDPGVRGYAMAVATDATGKPIQFNWLTGHAALKQAAPNGNGTLTAILSAHIVAKRSDGTVAPGTDMRAELIFDDVQYDRLPAQIVFDGVPSQASGTNNTLLSFFRPLADFSGTDAMTATVQVAGRSAQNPQLAAAGNVNLNCVAEVNVSQLRLAPVSLANLIPAGTTGWFTASTADLQPLLGMQLNSGMFSGGVAARPLSSATEYRIKIPVTAVTCSQ